MEKAKKDCRIYLVFGILLVAQLVTILYFCGKKTGFHYDEYYSYYSSNVTFGLVPTDREWKDGEEIRNEFLVLQNEKFRFSDVVRMQTYDVHPPFYYLLLHTACSLSAGIFSKWQGLILNLLFFAASWCLLALLTAEIVQAVWNRRAGRYAAAAVCLLYGFNPAVLSGIMLVRMYMLLGLFVLLITRLHVRALVQNRRGWRFYLPVMLTVYLGFLTHYYFAVYLFFLAAAMELYLLFETLEKKTWGQRWKDCFAYGIAVVGALALAAVSYPACLGHIFRGYRGTEAMGAFFDLSNTAGRIRFFVGLLNEYVFGGLLAPVILVLLLLWLTVWMLRRRSAGAEGETGQSGEGALRYRALWVTALAVTGYFAVVTKTALLTAEEANRYQLPAYGLILMLAVVLTALLVKETLFLLGRRRAKSGTGMEKGGAAVGAQPGENDRTGKNRRHIAWAAEGAFLLLLFAGEIRGLIQNRVLFLYEEDGENIAFAEENHDTGVIYFYNGNLTWMIWDDSLELMQYDRIYFVNMADASPLADEALGNADRALVYVARGDAGAAALEAARTAVSDDAEIKLLRTLLYCDLYEITAVK